MWIAAQSHESLLRQKARATWVKEGDCNSRFFHLLVNANHRNNNLNGVWIDEAWIEESVRVKEADKLFFLHRFLETDQHRPQLDGISFQTISNQQNDMLTAKFQEEEVKEVVWGCGSQKSPGPDGINFKFIKTF